MISGIANALSNTSLLNVAQNTALRVSIETSLKSIGRPTFILADRDIPPETKKYAATKEFVYQLICLGVYIAVIPAVFKAGSYKLGKKFFSKKHPEFNKFHSMNEYLDYHRLATKVYTDRKASLKKVKTRTKFMHDGLREELLNKETPETYDLIKGTIEAGTFLGSILGLAILAPEIGHHLTHPIMRGMGFEQGNTKAEESRLLDKRA